MKHNTQDAPCNSVRHGEYNLLWCCLVRDHSGEHNYVVVDKKKQLELDEFRNARKDVV